MKAGYLGRVVLEFRMCFSFLLVGVVTCGGGVSAQAAEALVAGHGAQTVVPFACLTVTFWVIAKYPRVVALYAFVEGERK
jgi:hypothetical protein